MKAKIRKGDTVEIISGREADKGKHGEVIRVMLDEGRIVIQGVNLRKKHQRQQQGGRGRSVTGGVIEFEAPIHISNVMLVCPKCRKPTRVGIRRDGDEIQRQCKKCESLFD